VSCRLFDSHRLHYRARLNALTLPRKYITYA
jgi:hypothetical protein